MRISALPCLTSVLYFHVPDHFRILVYTALFQLTCMHAYSVLVGLLVSLPPSRVCVWERERERERETYIYTYMCVCGFLFLLPVFWVQFPAPSCRTYFLWQKTEVFIYSVLHTERSPRTALAQLQRSPGTRCSVPVWRSYWRLGDKWQLYLCVLHESIKHWPFKMLPRYLRLSATSSWDQIGMLLRQSGTTHPPSFPCDVCDSVCRGIPCFIQLQMYTLNSCWCARNRAVTSPIWSVCFVCVCACVFVQLFLQNMVVLMQPVRLCVFGYLRTPSQVYTLFFLLLNLLEVVHIKFWCRLCFLLRYGMRQQCVFVAPSGLIPY